MRAYGVQHIDDPYDVVWYDSRAEAEVALQETTGEPNPYVIVETDADGKMP